MLLQKLGMQAEGRLRENEYYKGRWWDTLLFGLLDYEWKAKQPKTGLGEKEPSARL